MILGVLEIEAQAVCLVFIKLAVQDHPKKISNFCPAS
jgi:hypothetical protein